MMASKATAPTTMPASAPVDRPVGLGVLVGDGAEVLVSRAGDSEEDRGTPDVDVVVGFEDVVLGGLVVVVVEVLDEVVLGVLVLDDFVLDVLVVEDVVLDEVVLAKASSRIQNPPVAKPPFACSSSVP